MHHIQCPGNSPGHAHGTSWGGGSEGAGCDPHNPVFCRHYSPVNCPGDITSAI